MAKDVTTFLAWTAEPEHDQRKKMGLQVSSPRSGQMLRADASLGYYYHFGDVGFIDLRQAIQVGSHQEQKTVLQPTQTRLSLDGCSASAFFWHAYGAIRMDQ
jgi:hypothetical protein